MYEYILNLILSRVKIELKFKIVFLKIITFHHLISLSSIEISSYSSLFFKAFMTFLIGAVKRPKNDHCF